jgi:hypothetical protein
MSVKNSMLSLLDEASAPVGLEGVIAEIEGATDRNDHTGALWLWAKFLKHKKWSAVLSAAVELQGAWGSLPPGMSDMRREVQQALYADTEKRYGKDVAEKLLNAL